jgi:broad specificity phosphatase PhoE
VSRKLFEGTSIVLVRHARPVIDPGRPPGEWALDELYAPDVQALVESLRPLGLDGVVTSPEPKAVGTARAIVDALGVPLSEDEALREQGSGPIPWFENPDDFRGAVAEHFRRRDEAVFGGEASADAAGRCDGAVGRARARFRRPALVTHGRVMCGYLRDELHVDPVFIWSDLRMPDALMLDFEKRSLTRIGEETEV